MWVLRFQVGCACRPMLAGSAAATSPRSTQRHVRTPPSAGAGAAVGPGRMRSSVKAADTRARKAWRDVAAGVSHTGATGMPGLVMKGIRIVAKAEPVTARGTPVILISTGAHRL